MSSQSPVRCAGCQKWIIIEHNTEVHSATGQNIGHVHKAPPDTRSPLFLDCHKRAFHNLKHPVIFIQGRELNKTTVLEAERKRRKSGPSISSVPYALARVGDPSYAANTKQQSRFHVPA